MPPQKAGNNKILHKKEGFLWKRDLAIILSLCSTLLINTTGISLSEAKGTINRNDIEINYNPFSDEDVVIDDSKLSMTERLAKIQAEQENLNQLLKMYKTVIFISLKTQLKVELVNSITSKTAQEGENVDVRLVDNLIVNGVVVIPKGTIGKAYVYKARSAGGFGRKGILMIAGQEFQTINNVTVPLKQGLTGEGNSDGGSVAVAAVISLVGGAFMKGTNIEYPAGTTFNVEVRENVDLQATPENLKDVMNPNIVHGTEITINL